MRILFISNFYPPHNLGGMEIRCQETVERLQQRGHICHVLTSRYGVPAPPPDENSVTRTLHLQTDVNHYRPFDFFLRRPWQERANHRSLHLVMNAFKPDIVFIWGMWNLSLNLACWAEQWLPGKIAYNIGSYWLLDPDPHRQYWHNSSDNFLARTVLWPLSQLALGLLTLEKYPPSLQLRHVSCCSHYVMNELTKANVIPFGATVISNGINPTPFVTHSRQIQNSGNQLRLIYFGSLIENKGVHTAIEALGLLQKQNLADKLHLTIVGNGQLEYESRLHSLVKSLGLERKIDFIDRVPRTKIPLILQDHDVFLFTSTWAEPFGRTIIEAMAAGLAVIGADVGGSKEIFRLYSDEMLFPAGDSEALAQRILKLADEPALVQELGEIGQKLVQEHFTLKRMTDEMEAWLHEIAA